MFFPAVGARPVRGLAARRSDRSARRRWILGWVQLEPLEQGGTGQQHHSGGDQRYPGGRSEQPASGAHVLTEDPRRYTAATNGLAKVIPGWDATSRPACRAFWRRRNPTGKVRISK
jgi:hypothetical protein